MIRITLRILSFSDRIMSKFFAHALLSAVLFCAPALATAADEVNVYSYRQPFLTDPIFDVFTAETGIKVNTVFAKSGLLERLQNEGRNSPADLVLVANVGTLAAAVEMKLTQTIENESLMENVPESYRDSENHWFGLTSRARIIVTSKDRVEPGLIENYADLAKPELQGRVCTRSGKHGYMVELIASIMAHEGEETAQSWLQGLKSNLARKPQGNDRAQVKAISQGECDVAVINSYYMGAMINDPEQKPWADAINVVFPNQSNRGTHMNISGVFMTQAAPNKDNAIRLLEFLSQDVAQSLYAENNHEYPIKADVAASELVGSWGTFIKDELSLNEIAAHRVRASQLVDIVDYDG